MRQSPLHDAACGSPPSPIDPLALYAEGIDGSDYVARVAPIIRRVAPETGDLIDIGAGGGQLGAALRQPGRRWIAIEPALSMQTRLARLEPSPEVLPYAWDDARLPGLRAATVLAANMPAPLGDAGGFLARCRRWATRAVIWVVPAQNGPRGLCLAGLMPRKWHGEDETPGVDLVLARLGVDQSDHLDATDWTFSLTTADLPRLAAYLADRLGWDAGGPRRPKLLAHLAAQAVPTPHGLRLDVPRRSAILVWTLS